MKKHKILKTFLMQIFDLLHYGQAFKTVFIFFENHLDSKLAFKHKFS